jgi:hypothetical protein
MPNLDDFLKENTSKDYELEKLSGIRACSKCDEDVNGASWDPIELVMSWRCSKGHDTIFKVQ